MIPLLKEMVEILFTDGLLKLVFATSTFAIGLNMPAKSVIFTQQTKFDGTTNQMLSATEYLQMAGRAGRRGKDDLGASILCVDDSFGRVPHSDQYVSMFDNKGKDLESKLKLSYKTNLNVLNQQGEDISSLVANSFFSNETEKRKLNALQEKKKLGPRVAAIDNVESSSCEPADIQTYDDLVHEVRLLNGKLNRYRGRLLEY